MTNTPGYILYWFAVLGYFHYAEKFFLIISDRKVEDIDALLTQLDPKILVILHTGLQLFRNFDDVDAGRGLAVRYLLADDGGQSRKTVLVLRIIINGPVLINEGDVNWQGVKDAFDFLWCQKSWLKPDIAELDGVLLAQRMLLSNFH